MLIAEYDGAGVWQKDYVYLNGQPLAMIVAGTPESVYYYHNDHLGTPQMMTDSSGTVVWSATYEPFGKARINIGQITNNLRFPGQYYDCETGLHYNWFRYYDPQTGRYVEADPIGLRGGINLFVYVANNSINFIDLYGLQAAGGSCGQATRTCIGIARFSAIAPRQATGAGALSPFGVNPNSGTVAVSPAIFGLPFPEGANLTAAQIAQRIQSQRTLAQAASQIRINPTGLNLQGGPTSPYTIGDVGDVNIRGSQIPRFDIYRFPTRRAARQFGVQDVQTTITIPASLQCPPGFEEQR